jgi:hypothetical protein
MRSNVMRKHTIIAITNQAKAESESKNNISGERFKTIMHDDQNKHGKVLPAIQEGS